MVFGKEGNLELLIMYGPVRVMWCFCLEFVNGMR